MNTRERVGVGWKKMDLKSLAAQALGQDAPSGIPITDICEDSRRVARGSLFVAVPGGKVDGSNFISAAIDSGAVAVVAAPSVRSPLPHSVPFIQVPDPRRAAARLASVFYGLADLQRAGKLNVIGVTGTNGKTTVAYMLRHLLNAANRRAALLGTIEYDLLSRKLPSDLTTPDAITLTKHLLEAHGAGATDVVMEVSSHSLDQGRVEGIAFSTAVFTNLTQDHLDYHGTFDDYLLAKKRLFDGLAPDATAIVNAHDPASSKIIADCQARVVRYGLAHGKYPPGEPGARGLGVDVCATILREDRSGSRLLLEYEGKHVEVRTSLVGRHNIFNALAAAGVALASGVDLQCIQRGLANLESVPGRLQRVPTADTGFDVFVDYAHTDDALRNVLSSVRPWTIGRLWCVFGCGGNRDRTKRPKMARAVAEGADAFVITSDNPRNEDPLAIIEEIERGLGGASVPVPEYVIIPDRGKAIRHAIERLAPGDTLVIAGKGHENYQILGATKIHFDDVEAAADAIARRVSAAVGGRGTSERICVP